METIKVKYCKKCHSTKLLSKFTSSRYNKDGYRNDCNECRSAKRRNQRAANPEKFRAAERAYNEKNPETKKKKDKKYRSKEQVRTEAKIYFKEYYTKNQNTIKARSKSRGKTESYKEYKRQYQKERRDEDPVFRLIGNIRHRLNEFLKSQGMTKNNKLTEYLGCDKEFLRQHLESKFLSGMSWNNYGEWHIDHILPLTVPDITEEEIYKRNHYTNLQPMWAADNIKKSNKIIE